MHCLKLMAATLIGIPIYAQAQSLGTDATAAPPSAKARTISAALPSPRLGPNGETGDYLRAAYAAIAQGRVQLARQSLEMAETRAIGGAVSSGALPGDSPKATVIRNALRSLGEGDRRQAREYIKLALLN
jgi:hypothetical protein